MLRVAQKISQPGPGLGLGFRERGAGPAVALDLALRPAQSSAPADWPRTAGARSPMPREWRPAHAPDRPHRRGPRDQARAPARREPGRARDRGPVNPSAGCRPRSISTTGQARPVKRLSRSARDRVSNQRIGRSCSRGRSCLFQLPSRSCKITATRVKIRPLFSAVSPPRTRRLTFHRRFYCIAEQAHLRGLKTRRSMQTRLTRQSTQSISRME